MTEAAVIMIVGPAEKTRGTEAEEEIIGERDEEMTAMADAVGVGSFDSLMFRWGQGEKEVSGRRVIVCMIVLYLIASLVYLENY